MLTFLGDVFTKDHVDIRCELPGEVVFNLEAPLTRRTLGYPGKINLKGSEECLAKTFVKPPIAVGLANNHVMDFYDGGLSDTIEALDELGIQYFGAGTVENAWRNPCVVEVGGVSVAILGYAHTSCTPVFASDKHAGAAPLTLDQARFDIERARSHGADRVVVQAHWGEEHVPLPSRECIELGRALIDAGADIVIGHHAHCIQSFETHAGKPIFYGLGNCIFPAHRSPSYFDEHGKPTRIAGTEPAPRNRRSLAVSWEPGSGRFGIAPLVFEQGELKPGRFSTERYRLRVGSWEAYEARFARTYHNGKLRHTIERFIADPKLPRWHHLRTITRMLRSSPPA